MPVLIKDHAAALFIHIPKCGGSSFARLAVAAGWQELFSIRGIHADRLNYFRCTPQHFHDELLTQVFDLDRFNAVVTIVRHPFNRLKSEYYWQHKQKATQAAPDTWWNDIRKAYRDNPFVLDNHIRPQTEFLVASDKLEIFQLEQDGLQRALRALPGYSFKDRVKSSLRDARQWEKKSVYDDSTEVAFSRLRPEIEEFYAQDMARFCYESVC